ncbi:hypothetical protein [Streptomyces sp. A1547]|uniref:hypothetical protein n=1 Tax=Streptomyces sp. A1547 TaxID=2563105 RepID=UPI001F1054F0|nr:hypothetical protein [Streptomyces sp. A1547]
MSITRVRVAGRADRSVSLSSYGRRPAYTLPRLPSVHETVTSAPSRSASVAFPVPR